MIGAEDFRRALGHFATGVTILTTRDSAARPAGLTVSAFASLSLEPPLVLACVAQKAESYGALLEAGRFAVNVLSVEQEALSRLFASTGVDKFTAVPCHDGELGLPLIEGSVAHIECTTVSTHVEGDHTILVGLVEGARVSGGEPLLYFRGSYGRLARARPGDRVGR